MKRFNVRSTSDVRNLSEALFLNIDEEPVEMNCLGAASVNQAIKAYIAAKSLASSYNWKLSIDPCFGIGTGKEGDITVIKFIVSKV